MSPEEAIDFAKAFRHKLPDGWGFLVLDEGGERHLILTETEPPAPHGMILWLAKEIAGGRTLRGAVVFNEDDEPQDVEVRAWIVLGLLRSQERLDAALWN
jgi:hypothetical protein